MLLPEQVEALRSLECACREIGADVVVIGAIAYRAWVANDYRSPEGARVDLLPVGSKARHAKEIVWPRGETRMSVLGFEHVFRDAVRRELAPGLEVKVVPPPVLALMKVTSYMDSPYRGGGDERDPRRSPQPRGDPCRQRGSVHET